MSEETRPADQPATFRDVFGQSEYRALYAATTLSWLGDYIARAAITVIVFDRTNSVGWSAAAFAVSYLPWLIGGPLLATLAERHPYRRVMIACDLIRMPLIALVAVPHMPVPVMLVLLFLTTLANPPSQAARSALMPVILPGDRLVLGLSVNQSTSQAAQVIGYAAGAGLAAFRPEAALLLDAATFLASALIIRFGVAARPPAYVPPQRSRLVGEMVEGFRVVFGDSVRRPVAIIVFSAVLFAIVPEGLAAGWVEEETGTASGLYLALIMASGPLGVILGGLTLARLFPPLTRQRLVRPFAVLSPLALVPALLTPHPFVIALLAMISGFAVAGLLPVANGLFVQALPSGYRARAFGVMNTGMQLAQGGAVLVTGLLAANSTSIPRVVGLWSVAGVLLMLLVTAYWPSPSRFAEAIEQAARHPGAAAAPDDAARPDTESRPANTPSAPPTRPESTAPGSEPPPRPETARARTEAAPQQRGAGGERGGHRPAHVRP